MDSYLLDITTLITFISDLSNDKKIDTRFGDLEIWKQKNISIYNHIIDEKNDPVLPKLIDKLKKGKLLTTKLAWSKFTEMISMYGSDKEIGRMNDLKVEVIEDDFLEDTKDWKSKIWSDENKSIFGTALKKNYTIVTGNINALNDILSMGYQINYIAHRSRCFVSKRYQI